MKKRTKKVVSVFLTFVMSIVMFCVPVSAKETVEAPQIDSITVKSSTSVQLSWNYWNYYSSSSNVYVYYSKEKNGEYTLYGKTAEYKATVRNLSPNTTYYFKLKGKTKVNGKTVESQYSSKKSATTFASSDIIGVPSKITAEAKTTSSIKIQWDKCIGAEKYKVFYGYDANNMTLYGNTTNTYATIKNLETATPYYFKVQSIGTKNGKTVKSDFSNIFKLKTADISIDAPKGIKADEVSSDYVVVTWEYVNNANYYEVYYSTQQSSGYHLWPLTYGVWDSHNNRMFIDNLSPNTTYYIKVRGVADLYNRKVEGKFSSILKFTTKNGAYGTGSGSGSYTGGGASSFINYTDGKYILNTSTLCIHSGWCRAAKQISSSNLAYTDDLNAAKAAGYSQCGICKYWN